MWLLCADEDDVDVVVVVVVSTGDVDVTKDDATLAAAALATASMSRPLPESGLHRALPTDAEAAISAEAVPAALFCTGDVWSIVGPASFVVGDNFIFFGSSSPPLCDERFAPMSAT